MQSDQQPDTPTETNSEAPTREIFVEILGMYRDMALRQTDSWESYWQRVADCADNGVDAVAVAEGFVADNDVMRRHVAYDVIAEVARTHDQLRPYIAELLVDRLGEEDDQNLVASLTIGLGRTRHPGLSEVFVKLANAHAPSVRTSAATALVETLATHGAELNAAALRALLRLTGDDESRVRLAATWGLSIVLDDDGPEIRETLARRLFDSDNSIRDQAIRGLARRGDDRARSAIRHAAEAHRLSPVLIDAASDLGEPELVEKR